MYILELTPQHSGHKSFYGKAKVIIEDDGTLKLLSYQTIVCEIDTNNNFNMLWDGKSNTTTRHINEFKKQFLEV
jgi:queuine/archaeosine tRNA-ribosyltransferase